MRPSGRQHKQRLSLLICWKYAACLLGLFVRGSARGVVGSTSHASPMCHARRRGPRARTRKLHGCWMNSRRLRVKQARQAVMQHGTATALRLMHTLHRSATRTQSAGPNAWEQEDAAKVCLCLLSFLMLRCR